MYKNIGQDFFSGITNSIRFDIYIKSLLRNPRLQKLTIKILKYNAVMHFLPFLFFYLIGWSLNIDIMYIGYYLSLPINIFSVLFHLLHYIDLVNMVCMYSLKTSKTSTALDAVSLTITMSIYQLVIYLTTSIINLIFNGRMRLVAIMINFIILTIYHSFYCYNNLWQYKKIDMLYRIDMHEKLWPYYIGYGIVPTIIYLYNYNPLVLGLYNLYMILIISLPFMIKIKYPKNEMPYPKINLKIFSYFTGLVVELTKIILKKIFKLDSN